MKHGWPQGMLHNISSFVHSLEALLFERFLKLLRPNVTKVRQFESSDDKNVIFGFKKRPTESECLRLMRDNDNFGSLFSLEPSLSGKNTGSRDVTEMVSVINVDGVIVYCPIKQLNNMMSSFQDPDFVSNHKNLLSRLSAYFSNSNRLVHTEVVYEHFFRILTRSFNIPENFGPICAFGKKAISFLEYTVGGEAYDNIFKFYQDAKGTYNKILLSKKYRVVKDPNSKQIEEYLATREPKAKLMIKELMEGKVNHSSIQYFLAQEIDALSKSKRRMFLHESNTSYVMFYFKRHEKVYRKGKERMTALEVLNDISFKYPEEPKLDRTVFWSETNLDYLDKFLNKSAIFRPRYEPKGSLWLKRRRTYESLGSSFEDILYLIEVGSNSMNHPGFRSRYNKVRLDLIDFCETFNVVYVDQLRSLREQYEEYQEISRKNRLYRLQWNGEYSCVDCDFEVNDMDRINKDMVDYGVVFKKAKNITPDKLVVDLQGINNDLVVDAFYGNTELARITGPYIETARNIYQIYKRRFGLEAVSAALETSPMAVRKLAKYLDPLIGLKFTSNTLFIEWTEGLEFGNVGVVFKQTKPVAIVVTDEFGSNTCEVLEESKELSQFLRRRVSREIEFKEISANIKAEFLEGTDFDYVKNLRLITGHRLFIEVEYVTESGDTKRSKSPINAKIVNCVLYTPKHNLKDYVTQITNDSSTITIKGNKRDVAVSEHNIGLNLAFRPSMFALNTYASEIANTLEVNSWHVCFRDVGGRCMLKDSTGKLLRPETLGTNVTVCSRTLNWRLYREGNLEMTGEDNLERPSESTEKVFKGVLGEFRSLEDLKKSWAFLDKSIESLMMTLGRNVRASEVINCTLGRKSFNESLAVSRATAKKAIILDTSVDKEVGQFRVEKNAAYIVGKEEPVMYRNFFNLDLKVAYVPLSEIPVERIKVLKEAYECLPDFLKTTIDFTGVPKRKSIDPKIYQMYDELETKYVDMIDEYEEAQWDDGNEDFERFEESDSLAFTDKEAFDEFVKVSLERALRGEDFIPYEVENPTDPTNSDALGLITRELHKLLGTGKNVIHDKPGIHLCDDFLAVCWPDKEYLLPNSGATSALEQETKKIEVDSVLKRLLKTLEDAGEVMRIPETADEDKVTESLLTKLISDGQSEDRLEEALFKDFEQAELLEAKALFALESKTVGDYNKVKVDIVTATACKRASKLVKKGSDKDALLGLRRMGFSGFSSSVESNAKKSKFETVRTVGLSGYNSFGLDSLAMDVPTANLSLRKKPSEMADGYLASVWLYKYILSGRGSQGTVNTVIRLRNSLNMILFRYYRQNEEYKSLSLFDRVFKDCELNLDDLNTHEISSDLESELYGHTSDINFRVKEFLSKHNIEI